MYPRKQLRVNISKESYATFNKIKLFLFFFNFDNSNVTIFRCMSFVFPYGASLNVAKPAAPILTSGSVAYPLNRPLCAFYSASNYSSEGTIDKYLVLHNLHCIIFCSFIHVCTL